MDTILPPEILNIIFSHTSNFNIVFVCKSWYNIIIKTCIICKTCNKIEKMYDTTYWNTDEEDPICHGYYGPSKKYKSLKRILRTEPQFLTLIKRQSIGLCLSTLKRNPDGFKYIKHPTDKLIDEAIKVNPLCLQYAKNPSYEICLNCVSRNYSSLEFVPLIHKTEELCLIALNRYGEAIKYIDNPTEEFCMIALTKCLSNLQYIKNPSEKICLMVVRTKPMYLQYIQNPSEKVVISMINSSEWLKHEHYQCPQDYITFYTEDICVALEQKGLLRSHKIKYS